jgi:hypothetical protein
MIGSGKSKAGKQLDIAILPSTHGGFQLLVAGMPMGTHRTIELAQAAVSHLQVAWDVDIHKALGENA